MFSNHSKTFYKYLFSYLSLLLLGIIFFVIFIQGYIIRIYESEILKSHSIALEQTAVAIDTEIEQIYQIDYQITCSNENFLSYFLMKDTPTRDKKIITELHNSISTSSFISNIAMVSEDSDFIYTSSGGYPDELFFESIYHYKDWVSPLEDIYSIQKRMIRPSEIINEKDTYVTFINPPSTFSNFPSYTLLFWVRESKFTDILSGLNSDSSISLILDGSGNPILTPDNRFSEAVYSQITKALSDSSKEYHKVSIGNVPYYLFSTPSAMNDWNYITLLSTQAAFQSVHHIQIAFGIILIAALIIGLIVTYLYMRLNYLPLKQLKTVSNDLLQGNDMDEIETLRDAIHYFSAQNQTLHTTWKSEKSMQSLKDSLLFSILKGKISSLAEFNKSGEYLKMSFTKAYYQVLVISHQMKEEAIPREAMEQIFSEHLSSKYEFYFRDLFEANQYVMVVAADQPDMEEAGRIYDQIIRYIEQEYHFLFTIGAGNITSEFNKIPTSYFEATLALKESFLKGYGTLILFSEIKLSLKELPYPFKEMEGIKLSIQSQDYDKLKGYLDMIFQKLEHTQIRSEYAISLCNNISYLLLSLSSHELSAQNTADLLSLIYSASLDTYKRNLFDIVNRYSREHAPKDKITDEASLFEQIRHYINKNYDNCNFSIQDAANDLGMNGSYMSQLFKLHSNTTLIDYTTALRIEKAYSLLKNTNMPLNMVAEEIGYYNLNSFIRRFKQVTGITPGEYRKMNSAT